MISNFFSKYITPINILFFVIAILFIKFILNIKDIAILFFASYVIACSFNPIVEKLSKKIKRSIATAIVLFSAILIVLAFIIPLIGMIVYETKSFVNHVPQYIESLKTFVATIPFLSKTGLADVDIGDFISSAGNITTGFVNQSINISKNLAQAVIYLIAATIIIYYFIADKELVRKAYLSLFPKNMKEKADDIITSISNKIGGYVVAQLVTMASVGIVMTIGLLISRIDYALLLGLITAVLDIIPVVGPGIALIICLLTVFKSGTLAIVLVCVSFAVAQLVENNLVRPLVFGKMMDIHPLIIYLFLFITAQYLGVIGVIFAPPIAATVCVLIEELYIRNIN